MAKLSLNMVSQRTKKFFPVKWEYTLRAIRTVHDGLKHMECKIHDIPVTKELLKSCKQSRQRYSSFLEDQKKSQKRK